MERSSRSTSGTAWLSRWRLSADRSRTGVAVIDTVFELSYLATTRLAAVHAAMIVNRYRLPANFRRDLEQEAMLELWRKRFAYDEQRGSWPTFCEQVVANRMTSLVRSMYSTRSRQFREEPLQDRLGLVA